MATSWEGSSEPKKEVIELDGNKVVTERSHVIDCGFSAPFQYTRETILHFKDEEQAKEYYYKKK